MNENPDMPNVPDSYEIEPHLTYTGHAVMVDGTDEKATMQITTSDGVPHVYPMSTVCELLVSVLDKQTDTKQAQPQKKECVYCGTTSYIGKAYKTYTHESQPYIDEKQYTWVCLHSAPCHKKGKADGWLTITDTDHWGSKDDE